MNSRHAKSPCCGAKIYRFGPRRRRCSCCGRTWRIRRKRRGRPQRRIAAELLDSILLGKRTLRSHASRYGLTPQGLGYLFRKALARFLTRSRITNYPPGLLILLVDGLWFRFQGFTWVLYLMALKPCAENYAVFMDPFLFPGRENVMIWSQIFEAMPSEPRNRIQALVTDNLRGMKSLARRHGWVLQLCHFHLLSQLQGRRGRNKKTLVGRKIREALYQLTRQALVLPDGPVLQRTLRRLRLTVRQPLPARKMRMAVRQFLRDIHHYRAYQLYPELGLPTTTNTVETMGHIIRDLMRRTGNLRSPQSLLMWVSAFIRKRPRVTCNGKHFQPNYFV